MLFLILAIILLVVWWWTYKSTESYKVLGALAPQNQIYYHCLSQCERADPRTYLQSSSGKMQCQRQCEDALSCSSLQNKVTTINDEAYQVCGHGTQGDWCRQIYASDKEIDARCQQDCLHTDDPGCMEACARSLSANKSRGWTWK